MKTVVVALAVAAATTLVGLVVTDFWAVLKRRVGRLISGARGNSEAVVAGEPMLAVAGHAATEGAGVVSRAVLPPDEVPAASRHFVNRVDEKAQLCRRHVAAGVGAPATTVEVTVINGMRGVGKSALVWSWAEEHGGRFPGGRLYVDFAVARAETGGDVSEVVAMFLRKLGVGGAFIPVSLSERVGLYRTITAGLRILVVLDNVEEAAQVRALTPKGPGSVVLVTSNHTLDALDQDGARSLFLERLDTQGGLLLLAARCGGEAVAAEPDAAERLVELCGGLPMALHAAASRFSLRRGRTLTVLADQLADETRRLAALSREGDELSVSANFNLVYAELSSAAARLYRLLGWFPGPDFTAETAAVVVDTDLSTAEALLEELENASLLLTTRPGRYHFHSLVRLHAAERAAAEEPGSVHGLFAERLLTYFLVRAAFADRADQARRLRIAELDVLLREHADPFGAGGGEQAVAWLESERHTILALVENAGFWNQHVMGWQLAEAFIVLFFHHRHVRAWLAASQAGAACAAEAGDAEARARLLSLSSRPLMDRRDYERAHEALHEALTYAQTSGNTALHASVLEFFGRYWDHANPERAVAVYQESLRLNELAGEERGAALALNFLGAAQDTLGRSTEALETLRQARSRLLQCGDQRMAARALAAAGRVHDRLGDTAAAVEALSEAARVLRHEVDSIAYEAQARVDLARIVERTGRDPRTEREHLSRAWHIYTDGGSPKADEIRERLDELGGPLEE